MLDTVFHFCDSMRSFWAFLSFAHTHVCIVVGFPVDKTGRDSIIEFNSATLLCLFQARTCITNIIGRGFPFRVQSVMVRSRCSLVLILMIFFLLSLFKFSFHNYLFPVYGEVYSIQHYVINVSVTCDRSVVFLMVLRFPPPVKHHYITEILLKVALNTINQTTNLLRPFGTLAPTNISVYLFTISFPAERYSRNTS